MTEIQYTYWHVRNPVNGLVYGYGGVKLFPRQLLKDAKEWKIDLATSIGAKFKVLPRTIGSTEFNCDPETAWRSGFREAAKLASKLIKNQVDTETDPPTVKARAATFPLLVHELIKGVYDIFGTHGLPDDPKQAEMIMGAEDTLPAEIWDMRLGPIFWEKFQASYPLELFDEDKRHIQHYLFMRFSKLPAEDFFKFAKSVLNGDPSANKAVQRMVDEIVSDLKITRI